MRAPLPGPAHGAPREAIDLLGVGYREARGRRRGAGRGKFGVLHIHLSAARLSMI